MWVKICGTTNMEDAAMAAEAGADAVGFVFAGGPRTMMAAQVGAISARLPRGVERVGVFGSHSEEEIVGMATEAGLTAVQLHGGFDEMLAERLGERFDGRVRVIPTLHWTMSAAEGGGMQTAGPVAGGLRAQLERVGALAGVERVLLDSKVGDAKGGTGVPFDWAAARQVFEGAPQRLRVIVAGGLRPENVGEAIARLRPWGVDVASGVEMSPGRKDPARVALFVQNARRVTAA